MPQDYTPVFIDLSNEMPAGTKYVIEGGFNKHIANLNAGKIVPVIYRRDAAEIIEKKMGNYAPSLIASDSYAGVQYRLVGIPQDKLSRKVRRILNKYIDEKVEKPSVEKTKEQIEQKKAMAKKVARELLFAGMFAKAGLQMTTRLLLNESTVSEDKDYIIGHDWIPEVIIGALPLNCVQRIERGVSDLLIKYRAVGDVFLAHQKGSLTSLRIDGKFFGPFRKMYLVILLALQYAGGSTLANIDSTKVDLSQVALSDEDGKIDVKDGQYATHKTLPIFTQTDIMLDMYLQTIEWHHTVDEGGVKYINYSLLFRKYIEPNKLKTFDKKAYVSDMMREAKRAKLELGLDFIWKMGRIGVEVLRSAFTDGRTFFELNREAFANNPYFRTVDSIAKTILAQTIEGVHNVE